MSKDLPYFKFVPTEYLLGDITTCSMETQGYFINLCALYWQRGCSLPLATLKQRLSHPSALLELGQKDIIYVDEGDEKIIIKFLDEQWEELKKRHAILSESGRKGGQARLKPALSEAQALKNKKENKNKKKIEPPTLDEVKGYFLENGYTHDAALKAHKYYEAGAWHDSKGNPVKNWKQKMQSVWFKPENKLPKLPERKEYHD